MKNCWRNLLVSIVVIGILCVLRWYRLYWTSVFKRTFETPIAGIFVFTLLPMLIGVVISMPTERSKLNLRAFNWNKFLFQGVPALLLAIPWNIFVITSTQILDIHGLNLGILHNFFVWQEQMAGLYLVAGVWFGKVMVDCIWQGSSLGS